MSQAYGKHSSEDYKEYKRRNWRAWMDSLHLQPINASQRVLGQIHANNLDRIVLTLDISAPKQATSKMYCPFLHAPVVEKQISA